MPISINNNTELVSVQTLTRIANRIKNTARAIARVERAGRVGQKPNTIKVGVPNIRPGSISINLILNTKVAPEAAAYEWGSGIHDPNSPHYITIRPKRKKYLVFEGTNDFAGQTIFTQHVEHPGVEARPYLKPAIEETRAKNKEDLNKEVSSKIRLLVKGMARKV